MPDKISEAIEEFQEMGIDIEALPTPEEFKTMQKELIAMEGRVHKLEEKLRKLAKQISLMPGGN